MSTTCVSENLDETSFITLTNTGYVNYTLNCVESLKRIQVPPQLLHIYVIGKDGYNMLKNDGYNCSLIDDEANSNFQSFREGNWGDIKFNKFKIIYENLLKFKYVCITDGDIVFENPNFLNYLKDNIDTNDMLVQSEGDEYDDFCSGFMYIKSNEITRELFNPANVIFHKRERNWDDQIYLNEIRKTIKLKYKKLPLELFPNGKYYYNNEPSSPYMIHFNWLVGNQKHDKMKQYGKWYYKIKICQHGTDGFGHQLEGTLRLISLALNNKADYIYDLKKQFTFQHSNYDLNRLNSYLLKALEILSRNSINNTLIHEPNVIYNEQRTFEEIIKNDNNSLKNVYCYDGVGFGAWLPSNFESMEDMQKSLPILRNAFVLENHFLPPSTYNILPTKLPWSFQSASLGESSNTGLEDECILRNSHKNVVCHIRLGDAVGTRVLDNDAIFNFIRKMQNDSGNYITIHSDGDVDFLKSNNTTLCDKHTDVLQILSDFINADVLVMNYSSMSISAHLLADHNQKVFCPNVAGPTFFSRILSKCKKVS